MGTMLFPHILAIVNNAAVNIDYRSIFNFHLF